MTIYYFLIGLVVYIISLVLFSFLYKKEKIDWPKLDQFEDYLITFLFLLVISVIWFITIPIAVLIGMFLVIFHWINK